MFVRGFRGATDSSDGNPFSSINGLSSRRFTRINPILLVYPFVGPCGKITGQEIPWNKREARLCASSFMTNSRYTLNMTLSSGYTNGIAALQCSPDGRFLASGSGDSVLLVFSTSTWEPVKQFVDASSVRTLVWHPAIQKTVISGYSSGDV